MTLRIILDDPLTNQSDSSILPSVSEITKAAAILGRLGGKAKSEKKAAAVRANGLKGGRPRMKNIKPESLKRRQYRERTA